MSVFILTVVLFILSACIPSMTTEWVYLMPHFQSNSPQHHQHHYHDQIQPMHRSSPAYAVDEYLPYPTGEVDELNGQTSIPYFLMPSPAANPAPQPVASPAPIEQRSSLPEQSMQPSISRSSNVKVGGNGFWSFLRSTTLNNDVADRLFPFTIRIATHGEPHMPIVKVGHSPFTMGAGLWGKPELNYGKHVHHHPHSIPPPPALDGAW